MKILAIASAGGHWIQLLRLMPAFINNTTVFISTKDGFGRMVEGHEFIQISDSNRNNKMLLLKSFRDIYLAINKTKPDIIITTGAAPGLMGIIIGRLKGIKTIWVDSIANAEEISLSGRIAARFATRSYTQWPDLANKRFLYSGNILS